MSSSLLESEAIIHFERGITIICIIFKIGINLGLSILLIYTE